MLRENAERRFERVQWLHRMPRSLLAQPVHAQHTPGQVSRVSASMGACSACAARTAAPACSNACQISFGTRGGRRIRNRKASVRSWVLPCSRMRRTSAVTPQRTAAKAAWGLERGVPGYLRILAFNRKSCSIEVLASIYCITKCKKSLIPFTLNKVEVSQVMRGHAAHLWSRLERLKTQSFLETLDDLHQIACLISGWQIAIRLTEIELEPRSQSETRWHRAGGRATVLCQNRPGWAVRRPGSRCART